MPRENPVTTRPRMTTGAFDWMPAALPASSPTRTTRIRASVPVAAVLSVAPGWVDPSMRSGAVTVGSADRGRSVLKLRSPVTIANLMRSASGVVFASMIAARRVQRRASAVSPAVAQRPSPGSRSGLSPWDRTTKVVPAAVTGTLVTRPAPPPTTAASERDARAVAGRIVHMTDLLARHATRGGPT